VSITEIVKNVQAKTVQPIIKGKVSFDATVYPDRLRAL
jgi:transposase-like protein